MVMKTFAEVWEGGYKEGDPLNPMGRSTYGIFGYASVLYLIYHACIRPYVDADTVALEIGPGRGAFSRAILTCNPKHLYAVDAAPPEHTRFWPFVGIHRAAQATYITAIDESLDGVPDGSVNYFFSFGCFCHLPPEVIERYIASLRKKMAPGGHGFLMVADYEAHNRCHERPEVHSLMAALNGRRAALARLILSIGLKLKPYPKLDKNEPKDPDPGRFFHYGMYPLMRLLEREGFTVIEPDLGLVSRDVIAHFVA